MSRTILLVTEKPDKKSNSSIIMKEFTLTQIKLKHARFLLFPHSSDLMGYQVVLILLSKYFSDVGFLKVKF